MADKISSEFITVGITTPDFAISPFLEADTITQLLESQAIDYFHIRKLSSNPQFIRTVLDNIPSELHNRLVKHYSDELNYDMHGGVHIKDILTPHEKKFITRSCHSLEEIRYYSTGNYEYLFLSPVYDSISKQNYKGIFYPDDPEVRSTIKLSKVVALGGVTPDKFSELYTFGFAGAALLGYLWSSKLDLTDKIDTLIFKRVN